MSSLLEILLLAAFFLSYLWKGIYVATGVIMAGSVAAVAISWLRTRKVKPVLLITMVLALFLGGLTLFFRDPVFLKWKFSIVEWFLGLWILASQFTGRRSFIRLAMEESMTLPEAVWLRLNLMWGGFFLFLGTLNVYVIYSFSTDGWVKFKFWGSTGLMLAFVVVQALYLSRHMPEEQEKD
ncbi:MAG TPA: septation protein A [Gammaproteobacteria bacterium]|nr:septation protein A [Gammaproteobacteria bacterium]